MPIGYVALFYQSGSGFVSSNDVEIFVKGTDSVPTGEDIPSEQICCSQRPTLTYMVCWCGDAYHASVANHGNGRYVGVRKTAGAAAQYFILGSIEIYEPPP